MVCGLDHSRSSSQPIISILIYKYLHYYNYMKTYQQKTVAMLAMNNYKIIDKYF